MATKTRNFEDTTETLVERAFGLLRAGRSDEARLLAEQAWQLEPARPETLGLLAFLHRELGDADAAEFCSERVSAIRPEETDLEAEWDYGS